MKQTLLYKGKQFYFSSDDYFIILFTCKNNLDMLSNNEYMFGDGPFTYAPKNFIQFMLIQIIIIYR
jgi:hypothetical protein